MLRAPRLPLSGNDDMHIEVIGDSLAGVLEKMVEVNTAAVAKVDERSREVKTIFDAVVAPAISIRSYLRRIIKYIQCSSQAVILSLIYIDRLIERRAFAVTQHNAHRLLLSSILIAAKTFDDEFYSNGFFSQVGGILVEELNNLEMEFLFLLQFNTFVTTEKYNEYSDSLIQAAASLVVSPKTPANIRRIRDCQMEPQNEPPSPKRWMEPQSEPPSPKRMNMMTATAHTPSRCDQIKTAPGRTLGVFQFSPSVMCQ